MPEEKVPVKRLSKPAFVITTHNVPKDFADKPYFIVEAVQYNIPGIVNEQGQILRQPQLAPAVYIEIIENIHVEKGSWAIILHILEVTNTPKTKRKFFLLPSNKIRRLKPEYNDQYHGSAKFNDIVYHLYEMISVPKAPKKSNIFIPK